MSPTEERRPPMGRYMLEVRVPLMPQLPPPGVDLPTRHMEGAVVFDLSPDDTPGRST